jgi:hypothetical protein
MARHGEGRAWLGRAMRGRARRGAGITQLSRRNFMSFVSVIFGIGVFIGFIIGALYATYLAWNSDIN